MQYTPANALRDFRERSSKTSQSSHFQSSSMITNCSAFAPKQPQNSSLGEDLAEESKEKSFWRILRWGGAPFLYQNIILYLFPSSDIPSHNDPVGRNDNIILILLVPYSFASPPFPVLIPNPLHTCNTSNHPPLDPPFLYSSAWASPSPPYSSKS